MRRHRSLHRKSIRRQRVRVPVRTTPRRLYTKRARPTLRTSETHTHCRTDEPTNKNKKGETAKRWTRTKTDLQQNRKYQSKDKKGRDGERTGGETSRRRNARKTNSSRTPHWLSLAPRKSWSLRRYPLSFGNAQSGRIPYR